MRVITLVGGECREGNFELLEFDIFNQTEGCSKTLATPTIEKAAKRTQYVEGRRENEAEPPQLAGIKMV